MKKLVVMFLFSVMVLGLAPVAMCQDPGQEEQVDAIQNRLYQRSHEIGLAAGYIPDDNFFEAFPVGGYYMFTFNEHFAWEVARAQWIFTNEKDVKKDLENEFGVQPSEFSEPKYMLHSNLVFTPFYGKDAFFNRKIINHQIFFVVGGGVVHYDNETGFSDTSSETAPSLSLGAGIKFFLSENWAANLDLRNYTNFRENETENRIYLGLGLAYRFDLSPRKKVKDPEMEKLNRYLKDD